MSLARWIRPYVSHMPGVTYLLLCFHSCEPTLAVFSHGYTASWQEREPNVCEVWTTGIVSIWGLEALFLYSPLVTIKKCQEIKTYLSLIGFPPLQLPDPDWKQTESRWDDDTETNSRFRWFLHGSSSSFSLCTFMQTSSYWLHIWIHIDGGWGAVFMKTFVCMLCLQTQIFYMWYTKKTVRRTHRKLWDCIKVVQGDLNIVQTSRPTFQFYSKLTAFSRDKKFTFPVLLCCVRTITTCTSTGHLQQHLRGWNNTSGTWWVVLMKGCLSSCDCNNIQHLQPRLFFSRTFVCDTTGWYKWTLKHNKRAQVWPFYTHLQGFWM